MLVDKVEVSVKAGDGGNGVISFRHEKFIDRGGPDGGDGGKGGDVVLVASNSQNTLANFRYKKLLKAEPGKAGGKRKKHGKSGRDLEVKVPVGTVVASKKGEVLADLSSNGQRVIIAIGGHGGFGNAHFVSSRRQTPRIAEKGEKGENLDLILELKLIADIGIVGLPNAGKSTLLSTVSNARPQIADYPFTTLEPNLGVVDIDNKTSLLLADVPGLIEGASKGKGLGGEFLRHIERTVALLHLIDIYEDAAKSYKTVQKELSSYQKQLVKRPQVIVLNKIDGVNAKTRKAKLTQIKKVVPKNTEVIMISAASGEGVDKLKYLLKNMMNQQKPAVEKIKAGLPVITLPINGNQWKVHKHKNEFVITGKKIEKFASRTDFSNSQGVERLKDIMRKMGIVHELTRQNIEPGAKVYFGEGKIMFISY